MHTFEKDILVPFKGNRSYLHSTNIIDAVNKAVQETCANSKAHLKWKFNFRSLANKKLKFISGDLDFISELRRKYISVIDGEFIIEGNKHYFLMRECGDIPNLRVPDNEDKLAVELQRKTMCAKSQIPIDMSFIETAVALTKKLNLHVVNETPKWLVSRIDVDGDVLWERSGEVEVIVRRVRSPYSSINSVYLKGGFAGEIHFAGVKV